MSKHYLRNPPEVAMRVAAGYAVRGPVEYALDTALDAHASEFYKLIFPWAWNDELLTKLQDGNHSQAVSCVHLFRFLSKTLVQGMLVLVGTHTYGQCVDKGGDHPLQGSIFSHDVFNSWAFRKKATNITKAMQVGGQYFRV